MFDDSIITDTFQEKKQDLSEVGVTMSVAEFRAKWCGKSRGYLVWGVDDATHEIVGTSFDYRKAKKATKSWRPGSRG